MNKHSSDNYFIDHHLNDEAIALFADALFLNEEEKMPDVIRNHAEDCQDCKKEIIATYDILLQDKSSEKTEKHPYFDLNSPNEKKVFKLTSIFKIAAALLFLIGIGSAFNHFYNTSHKVNLASGNKIIHDFVLPDGSVIDLNKNSMLHYSTRFLVKQRTLSLSGEAYFKVKKDASAPFIISV
jgi:ferric-dicitrate binding protein FerR (iron transport regulator)